MKYVWKWLYSLVCYFYKYWFLPLRGYIFLICLQYWNLPKVILEVVIEAVLLTEDCGRRFEERELRLDKNIWGRRWRIKTQLNLEFLSLPTWSFIYFFLKNYFEETFTRNIQFKKWCCQPFCLFFCLQTRCFFYSLSLAVSMEFQESLKGVWNFNGVRRKF